MNDNKIKQGGVYVNRIHILSGNIKPNTKLTVQSFNQTYEKIILHTEDGLESVQVTLEILDRCFDKLQESL